MRIPEGLKLKSLHIHNFKGFLEAEPLNLDADLILLVGANARGKTSTIEAIEFALTGRYNPRIGSENDFEPRHLINRNLYGKEDAEASVSIEWNIDGLEDTATVNCDGDYTGGFASRGQPWSDQHYKRLLSITGFVYADLSSGFFGLEDSVKNSILEAFAPVPDSALFNVPVDNLLERISGCRARIMSGSIDPQDCEVKMAQAAAQFSENWIKAGYNVESLTNRPQSSVLSLAPKRLRNSMKTAGIDLVSNATFGEELFRYAMAIEALINREQLAHRTEAERSGKPDVLSLERLCKDLEGTQYSLQDDAGYEILSDTSQRLSAEILNNDQVLKDLKKLQQRFLSREQSSLLPADFGSVTLGYIPFIASALTFSIEQTVPDWSPPWSPGIDLRELLSQTLREYLSLSERMEQTVSNLAELRAELDQVDKKKAQNDYSICSGDHNILSHPPARLEAGGSSG
jgi:hypothetical protein